MLQAFTSLPVVREVTRADALAAETAAYRRDTIALGWEERLRTRGRRVSEGGVAFATALPRGCVLRAGDCFVLANVVIEVLELEEPVFVVKPTSAAEWALYGYLIGNSHQPVMICDDAMVCPAVPGMEQVLQYHRIAFSRDRRRFTPVALSAEVRDHRHQV